MQENTPCLVGHFSLGKLSLAMEIPKLLGSWEGRTADLETGEAEHVLLKV